MKQQETKLVEEAEEARQRQAQLVEATAQARLACLLLHTACALLVHCLCTACTLRVCCVCAACALLVHYLCTACALLVHCIPSSALRLHNVDGAQTQQPHCPALRFTCTNCVLQGRAESAAEVEWLRERLRMGNEQEALRERECAVNEAARAAELVQLRAQRDLSLIHI